MTSWASKKARQTKRHEGKLVESATAEDSSVIQQEGTRKVVRRVRFYNLDAIISVVFRVNSKRGIQFRQWANNVIQDHLLKGYSINQYLYQIAIFLDGYIVKTE